MNLLTYILIQTENPLTEMAKGMRGNKDLDYSLFFKMIGVIVVIVLFSILVAKIHFRHKKAESTKEYKLFEDLLDVIQLNRQEKDVLKQMVREARLKQPAMCLVTPALMEKSKELWLKEKGQKLIKDGKIQILNEITHKLHDYSVS